MTQSQVKHLRVLIIGGGAREHALAWKVAQSPRCSALFVAPGNEACPGTRVGLSVDDVDGICALADAESIDVVIVGPEAALAVGLADALRAIGVMVFGPGREASRLEWSKAYTRSVAAQLGLASPAFATFESPQTAEDAIKWWRHLNAAVVVKQAGLAGGKGVVVPNDDAECERAIREFIAVGPIVLEARLIGPECSLIALCDGVTARALPLAQDHKRVGEGDTGLNTGGMGAYAPAPVPYDADALTAEFIQPVLDLMAANGTPYVGALYAGLMLTNDGPKLLEFNCRFGDPEAQVLLPLIDGDFLDLIEACCQGRLADHPLQISAAAALGVVVAAPNYPASGPALPTVSMPVASESQVVFRGNAGGREYTAVGMAATLDAARDAAYDLVGSFAPTEARVRRDIGWRAKGAALGSYAAAGVDIDEGTRAVDQLKDSVEATHTSAVLGGIGAFGGTFDLSEIVTLDQPLLVASTDGVGTKVELAARAQRFDVPGQDIVNHCVNDVLVQGARPLFFLDYFASSVICAEQVAAVVAGMAKACAENDCVLLGGETAEMPGVYMPGAFDVAGTLVGVVEKPKLLPRKTIIAGDSLLAIGSSGPHTNGYSLLRKLFDWLPLDAMPAPLEVPIGDALLVPHRSYLATLRAALDVPELIKGLAHITGGGLIDNVPRILPGDCDAVITLGSWPMPPLFQLVEQVASALPVEELYRTLNMGVGMVVVVAQERVAELQALIAEPTWLIGAIAPGTKTVQLLAA